MRNTIIFGLLVTLFGFTAAAAQASDWRESGHQDGRQVSSEASTDSRGGRRDRNERSDRWRERHDEAAEHRESRERHDESRERHHRR